MSNRNQTRFTSQTAAVIAEPFDYGQITRGMLKFCADSNFLYGFSDEDRKQANDFVAAYDAEFGCTKSNQTWTYQFADPTKNKHLSKALTSYGTQVGANTPALLNSLHPYQMRVLAAVAAGKATPIPTEILHELEFHVDTYLEILPHRLVDTKPGYIRYFESEEKAARGIVAECTFGTFMTKIFGEATGDLQPVRRDLVTKFMVETTPLTFDLLTDTDEIVQAYTKGPHSCMSPGKNNWRNNTHPCSVYGGDSDIKLAILRKGSSITARALVWPEKKIHSRIYGDFERLGKALMQAGYSHGPLDGAKLNTITDETHGLVVMPYVDAFNARSTHETGGATVVTVTDKLEIFVGVRAKKPNEKVKQFGVGSTGGYIQVGMMNACPECNRKVIEWAGTKTYSNGLVCPACLAGKYAEAVVMMTPGGSRTNGLVRNDRITTLKNGTKVYDDAAEIVVDARTEELIHVRNAVLLLDGTYTKQGKQKPVDVFYADGTTTILYTHKDNPTRKVQLGGTTYTIDEQDLETAQYLQNQLESNRNEPERKTPVRAA